MIGQVGFDTRIRELVDGRPELADIAASLLSARRCRGKEVSRLHRKALATAKDDGTYRRLMTVRGVCPVVALAFTSTIDIPARFRHSQDVGVALGPTPVLKKSGEGHLLDRKKGSGYVPRTGIKNPHI